MTSYSSGVNGKNQSKKTSFGFAATKKLFVEVKTFSTVKLLFVVAKKKLEEIEVSSSPR